MKKCQRIEIKPGDKFGKLTVIEEIKSDDKKHRKIKCVCECGNYHITQPAHLVTGHVTRCRKCTAKHMSDLCIKERGYTIEYVREYCSSKNVIFLDDWYTNVTDKHSVKCIKCGYEWKTSFIEIENTTGCPKCQIQRAINSNRYTIKEINDKLKHKGIVFLDTDYSSQTEFHNFKCNKCNHIFTTRLLSVLRNPNGHLCHLDINDVRDFFIKQKYIISFGRVCKC